MLRQFKIICCFTLVALVAGCGDGNRKIPRVKKTPLTVAEETAEKPRLKAATPNAAKVGATVKLTGTDLGTGGKVFFGTTAASQTSSWKATSLSVVVPPAAGNTVYVVTNGIQSNKIAFTVLSSTIPPPPVIPTGTLTGTVFSSTAVTVAGAKVAIASNGSFSANLNSVLTNAAGVYSIVLPAGDYYIKASKDVNGNTIFFEVGTDEIGWGSLVSVVANQTVTGNITLVAPANASITGTLTQTDTSWGASVSGVTSFDRNRGVVRYYATPTTGAQYALPEVSGANVGVIAFRDLNNNSLFDAGVEPAITLNPNVAVPSTGINGAFPSRRVLSGTVTNGAGWTLIAVDQNNSDPAGNAWIVGTQLLGASGAFSIAGLPTQYRLVAFQDANGNGVPDNGETELVLSQPDVDTSGGNATGLSYVIPLANQGIMAGTIFDSLNNPAPFAHIVVADNATFDLNPRSVIADSLGNYSTAVPDGDYYVKASKDVDGDTVFFEVGVDEIGWNGVFTVVLGTSINADVNLDPVAQSTISGTLTDTSASWGSAATGVASYDLGTGFVRYQTMTNQGAYSLKEVTGVTVGLITFRDVNGNGKFDPNVEPAMTINPNVIAPATGINFNWTTRVQRTLTGTVTNGAGWTLYAQDRINFDPSGSFWIVGTQVLGATGAFSITGLPTQYRLRAFLDFNGNRIPDGNEPDIRVRNTDGTRTNVDVTAANATGITKVIRPLLQIQTVRVTGDTNGDGYLQPGESGNIEITLRNTEGPATTVTATATAIANVTVNGKSGPPATMAYNAVSTMSIAVTAANAAVGDQIEIDIAITAGPGLFNTVQTVFIGLFAGAPYTVATIPAVYASISTNGNAVRLPGAENDQNSEFLDFQVGPYFTGSQFAFPLYGMWMTDGTANPFGNGLPFGLDVGDNGYVDFLNNNATNTPLPLPSYNVDTQFVMAPLWSDLMPNEVWALVTGTAPTRTLTLEWKGAARFPTPTLNLNFQLKLYETTGTMDVIYDTVTLVTGDQYGLNYGDGSTITRWPAPAPGTAVRLTRTW